MKSFSPEPPLELKRRPIGVFDSGVGGLTALGPLIKTMPREDTIYFGDVARTPYGDKSPADIRRFALEALEYFTRREVKALVVACNSASAAAISALETQAQFPVFDVICPGARSAVVYSKTNHIGVIGTSATINSGLYRHTVKAINPDATVYQQACPKLAPLIEEGVADETALRAEISACLAGLPLDRIDTLILGCTHYPLVKHLAQDICGPRVRLIDSGEETAKEVAARLQALGLSTDLSAAGEHEFFVSAQPQKFRHMAQRFLGKDIAKVSELALASLSCR